jgi:hypothetical protein
MGDPRTDGGKRGSFAGVVKGGRVLEIDELKDRLEDAVGGRLYGLERPIGPALPIRGALAEYAEDVVSVRDNGILGSDE